MKIFSNYKSSLSILLSLLSFCAFNTAYATPIYQPGQTLNPSCTPADSNCAVVPISASLGTMTTNNPIYVSTVEWQHPRGADEITGTTTYAGSYQIFGLYEQMPSNIDISAIKANVWSISASENVTLKLFARSSSATFNPDTATPLYTSTINAVNMPKNSTAGGFLFNLTNPVTVTSGQYLFVIFESATAGNLKLPMFTTDSSSVPYRHGIIFGPTNANFYQGSGPTFSATTFSVYSNVDITSTMTESLGSELLSNGGFETLSGTTSIWTSWDTTSNPGIDETVLTHSGSHAAKLISLGNGWYKPQLVRSLTLVPGQKYQLSFWTRGDGTHTGKYAIYDATNLVYLNGTSSGFTTGISTTTYTNVTTTFTVPTGCTTLMLYFVPENINGATAYFDDISLKTVNSVKTLVPVSVQTVIDNITTPSSNNIVFTDPNSLMTSKTVQNAILEAYNHSSVSPVVSMVAPRIILPDTLYAVVGDKLQLFVRGIIEAQNPYNLPYELNSSVGNSYPRYFEYTPVVGDVGTKSVTVKIFNQDYSLLNSKTVNLKVSNPTGQPLTPKNILTLGDSLTAGGVWPAELYRRLTQTGGTPTGLGYSNINFIGDKSLPGYPTQAYTGFGGWTYGSYNGTGDTQGHVLTGTFDKDKSDVSSTWLDTNGNTWAIAYATGGLKIFGTGTTLPASGTLTHVSGATHTSNIVYTSATTEPRSPFWNSTTNQMSISSWATRNGYSSIDAVYVLLGWNSTQGAITDYSSYMADVSTFLGKVHTDFPNAIIRIVGIQIPSVNGGLGNNYGANISLSQYYGTVRTANSINTAYQNLANDPAYSSWVKFISTAPQFDSENNMPQALTPVNSRNTATEYRGTNGVHPDTTGYYQIADAVYREFVNTFLSN